MYHFIYETTNLINGKKYRGCHKTENLDDKYLGSGKAFKCALAKYGKDNFSRQILEHCSSVDDMLEREKFYVDADWVANRNSYNLKPGGYGSAGIEPWNKGKKGVQQAWNKGLLSGPMSEAAKQKKSKTLIARYKTTVHHSKGGTPWNKDKTGLQEAWNKGKHIKKSLCPHCNKMVDIGNLKRWHLDNCKFALTVRSVVPVCN